MDGGDATEAVVVVPLFLVTRHKRSLSSSWFQIQPDQGELDAHRSLTLGPICKLRGLHTLGVEFSIAFFPNMRFFESRIVGNGVVWRKIGVVLCDLALW